MRQKLTLIAGPCVIESREQALSIAARLRALAEKYSARFFFKASFDKANRLALSSYRGPGLEKGLEILAQVKAKLGVRLVTDVHETPQVPVAAQVVDVLQIPAFLCRQTDLVVAAARTKKIVNIKKGQFLAPWDMEHIVEKARSTGNARIWVTERGTSFGYNRLIVDMVSLEYMKRFGCPVIFDLTHSLQLPGGRGNSSGGQKEFVYALARAAAGVGVDGFFIEVHPRPERALSDARTSVNFKELEKVLQQIARVSA